MKKAIPFLLTIWLFTNTIAKAQTDSIQAAPKYVDGTDIGIVIRGKKHPNKSNTGTPEKGKMILFVVPAVGSNPFLGTFYGVGATGAVFLGEPSNTSISSLSGSLLFTMKDQFVGSVKGTIMTPKNGWEMLVDLKYSIFSENTYGIGSDYAQPVNDSFNWGGVQSTGTGGAPQPLAYKQVRIYYTAMKEIRKHVYVGLGYHLDYHYDIRDLALDTAAAEPVITSHYAYNTKYGFNTQKSTTSGTSFNVVFDSRDHTVNTYKGMFVQLTFVTNQKFLGSDQNSDQIYFETRFYKSLSKARPRHLIGFWAIGNWLTHGNVPYLHLPMSGGDMRNRIGRGYVASRFRGTGWITAETEYRFPITKNGLIGGVVFGSVTTTSRPAFEIGGESEPKLNLFEATRPAGGIGARLMLNRTGRLNLTADFAVGQHGAKGLYIAVGETF